MNDRITAKQRAQYRLQDDDWMTVCSTCQTASCWAGRFMCDESREAGTCRATVGALEVLDLEHPSEWIELRRAEGYM